MKKNQTPRLFKSVVAIGLVCLILCLPSISLGWGAGLHMMVAHIAYARLNPKAKAQVRMLLAIPINPSAVTMQRRNFVSAAHWADDLRPFAEFDSFKALHFIDQPFFSRWHTVAWGASRLAALLNAIWPE
jgi:hypothetical protein